MSKLDALEIPAAFTEAMSNQDDLGARIRQEIAAAATAEHCLALAAEADAADDAEAKRACLQRAVTLDRHCQAALLNLAALSLEEEDAVSAFGSLEEAARVAPLPADAEPLREQLYVAVRDTSAAQQYLRMIGREPAAAAAKPLSVLVISSVFPSSDPADTDDGLSTIVRGLSERGHQVRVLTAEPTGSKQAARETNVMRTLRLGGSWRDGKAVALEDGKELRERIRDNTTRVRTAVTKSSATLVLAANFELLDPAILQPAFERGVPVLHLLDTARAPFPVEALPTDPNYAIAPASDWTGTALRNAGYQTTRMDTVYPGVRFDRSFRLFLPDTDRLRICYAAPVRPTYGVETLIQALIELHNEGLKFSAEISGEATDGEYLAQLHAKLGANDLSESVRFVAPAEAGEFSALLARNNVFVFAHQVPEPFAVAQLRAMASGVVVVSSGTGGTKEIVRDGVDGLQFRPGDARDLAQKLASLAHQPESFERLQRAGQGRAMNFSAQRTVDRIESVAGEMQAAIEASKASDLPSFS